MCACLRSIPQACIESVDPASSNSHYSGHLNENLSPLCLAARPKMRYAAAIRRLTDARAKKAKSRIFRAGGIARASSSLCRQKLKISSQRRRKLFTAAPDIFSECNLDPRLLLRGMIRTPPYSRGVRIFTARRWRTQSKPLTEYAVVRYEKSCDSSQSLWCFAEIISLSSFTTVI